MNKKGFSLPELLVVVGIIGILATIVITALGGARNRAKIAAGQMFENSIYNNYSEYLLANYTFDEFDIDDTPAVINSEDDYGASATTNASPVVVEGVMGNALNFNSAQFLRTDMITGVRAISMWVNIDSVQTGGWKYLLDARTGLGSGYFADPTISGNWSQIYVNGVKKPRSWDSIPRGVWVHLYIISNTQFNDDINFMSRYTGTEGFAGSLDNVRIYSEIME